MQSYRISKYNPEKRDASGFFTGEEWTSFSDVDSLIEGKVLTLAKYEEVESAYVGIAQGFLLEAGVTVLYAVGVENSAKDPEAPMEGAAVKTNSIGPVLTAMLRERFWCKLENANAFLHIGWDYYMYIGVARHCPIAASRATEVGLFVEMVDSPYA
jgi:hypothetical protein